MVANTHVEQTKPDPGVVYAQGGNTQVLVLSDLPLILHVPSHVPFPSLGLWFLVQSTVMVSGK